MRLISSPLVFSQLVILSDGSSFTSYTTAPSPAAVRLTRDITNNPLWNPSQEGRRASDADEGGRLARFKKRSAGLFGDIDGGSGSAASSGSGAMDFSDEAGVQEKVSAKDMGGPKVRLNKRKAF